MNPAAGIDPNVLLHEDSVRPVRHWCARKDANRASGRNWPLCTASGHDAVGDRERRACGCHYVSEPNRVPVDGGVSKWRERHRGNQIAS
jgi:hypothetical protein